MTFPNVVLPMFPSTDAGPVNWVWLKTLKASMRKSSDFDSVIFTAFVSVMPRYSAPRTACKQL